MTHVHGQTDLSVLTCEDGDHGSETDDADDTR